MLLIQLQAFLLHFWEFIPKKLQFSYEDAIITANLWSNIIALAARISIRIHMVESKYLAIV